MMEWLNLHADNWDECRQRVLEKLKEGGVAVLPTETVYGIMTSWTNTEGRDRIYKAKQRAPEKQLQMLAPVLNVAYEYGLTSDWRLDRISQCFFPGPLTVVVKAAMNTTIGVRIPDDPFLLYLLRSLSTPVAASSANHSGDPSPCTALQAVESLTEQPDVVIDGGETSGQASTVISLTDDRLQLLREGPIALSEIEEAVCS